MGILRAWAAVAATILALAWLAPVALADDPMSPIHLVKDCSQFDGNVPSLCTISASDLQAIPVGSSVWYTGPLLTNVYFLSSFVTLDDENGSTATGYCIFDARAAHDQTGLCTFWAGTGNLAEFTAILNVTIDDVGLWHWDGDYHLPALAGHIAPTGRLMSSRPT
jgi:hypothetical protein